MVESEEDSDMDTGFYSDGEEAAPAKRKSLLVALRCVSLCKGYHDTIYFKLWDNTSIKKLHFESLRDLKKHMLYDNFIDFFFPVIERQSYFNVTPQVSSQKTVYPETGTARE